MRSERSAPCMVVLALAALVCLAVFSGPAAGADKILPTDTGEPELAVPGPVLAPITHQEHFRGERELFGYKPRFAPGVVTFDRENRPHILDGTVVQPLNDDGRWIGLDAGRGPGSGVTAAARIVFAEEGDAYMLGLYHSRDRGRTWRHYPTPNFDGRRIEFQDGHNRI